MVYRNVECRRSKHVLEHMVLQSSVTEILYTEDARSIVENIGENILGGSHFVGVSIFPS